MTSRGRSVPKFTQVLEVRAESGRSLDLVSAGAELGAPESPRKPRWDPIDPPISGAAARVYSHAGDWEWWNSNRYLMGLMVTLGSYRPSLYVTINHLYCLLFSAWFSRVRVMFRINHGAHLLANESIFINAVPKGALILADQSKANVLGALRAGWLRACAAQEGVR